MSLCDLMTVEKGILCACCLSASYNVVLLGLVKGLACSKHGIIVRWAISLDKIPLGDSVSFGLCSDLFTVQSDYLG